VCVVFLFCFVGGVASRSGGGHGDEGREVEGVRRGSKRGGVGTGVMERGGGGGGGDWVRRLGWLGACSWRFQIRRDAGNGPRFSVGGGFQHLQDLHLGISLRGLCVTELRSPSENSLVSN
jgi:hypothetical protein